MADFLPNLEDGENWLSSDIIREIESTVKIEDGYPQTFGAHAYSYLPVQILGIAVSPFLMPVIVTYLQGGVHVLLPILYHIPGPFNVPVPCYVGNALGGGCFGELMGQVPLSPVLSSIGEDMEFRTNGPVKFSQFFIQMSRSGWNKAVTNLSCLNEKNSHKLARRLSSFMV